MDFTDIKIFFDTNILAYIFDSRDGQKQKQAKEIFIRLVSENNCCISTQVLQELFNVMTKKLKYSKEDAKTVVCDLMNLSVHQLNNHDIKDAMNISLSAQFSIYDALIIAAAKSEGCSIVYSEDLNDGQIVDGVKIVNPFAEL